MHSRKFLMIHYANEYLSIFSEYKKKGIRTPSLISMTIIGNGLILRAITPLSGFYRPDLLSFFWYTLKKLLPFSPKNIWSKSQCKCLFSHLTYIDCKILLMYCRWKLKKTFRFYFLSIPKDWKFVYLFGWAFYGFILRYVFGGNKITSCLKLLRVMLETSNLAWNFTHM